jgi:NCS1 family nucleobase:cation symporter-1
VVLCDYYFIRKGYYYVPDLFSASKTALYHYNGGWNWRAYVGYIAGIIPCLPGFLDNVGVKGMPQGAIKLYYLAMPVGIFVGGAVYYGLNAWKPPAGGLAKSWNEGDDAVLYGEEFGSDSAGELEITQIPVGGKAWDGAEKA